MLDSATLCSFESLVEYVLSTKPSVRYDNVVIMKLSVTRCNFLWNWCRIDNLHQLLLCTYYKHLHSSRTKLQVGRNASGLLLDSKCKFCLFALLLGQISSLPRVNWSICWAGTWSAVFVVTPWKKCDYRLFPEDFNQNLILKSKWF